MKRSILPHTKNPTLRKKAEPVPLSEIESPRIRQLITDMKGLLAKEEYGVALAAPQVGESLQLFIVSGRALARDGRSAPDEPGSKKADVPALPDEVYINPKLLKLSRAKSKKHEGCLSVRGKWGIVPRSEKATVQALDERGRKILRGASGFLAHIFQHEMDHLNGILYTDKVVELYDDPGETENQSHRARKEK
jgi:peptide deformylase